MLFVSLFSVNICSCGSNNGGLEPCDIVKSYDGSDWSGVGYGSVLFPENTDNVTYYEIIPEERKIVYKCLSDFGKNLDIEKRSINYIQNLVIPNYVMKNGVEYAVYFDPHFTFTPIKNYFYGDIYFNNFLTEVPAEFLKECHMISNVYVQQYIRKIGTSAFSECLSLKQLAFFNFNTLAIDRVKTDYFWLNIEEIGDFAFNETVINCTLEFSMKLTVLGISAFESATSLKTVMFYSGALAEQGQLKESTFNNCKTLITVYLNSCIKTIGSKCFMGCAYLEDFYWDVSSYERTTIQEMAFNGCEWLFRIENSTHDFSPFSIGEYSFAGCPRFTFSYSSDKSLIKTSFLQSTTFIGSFAFYECTMITRLDIYNNDNISLGRNSFYNCTSIVSLYFQNFWSLQQIQVAIPTNVEAFSSLAEKGEIHISKNIDPQDMRDYFDKTHIINKFYLNWLILNDL